MTWLERYMKYTATMESPSIFHRWVAIAVVGHTLGRKVWLSRDGKYAIFPGQIMAVLVSPSATARKTTAIQEGVKLLRALPPGTVNVLPAKTSPQKLLQALQPLDEDGVPIEGADCVGLIVAPELGTFFSSEGFLETMATHVTSLFDAPHGKIDPETLAPAPHWERFDFIKWHITLRNPCAGMIGATTPSGIADELPKSARQTGFIGRVLWPYAQETDRDPNSMSSLMVDEDRREWGALYDGMVRMAELEGPFRYSKQAKELYDGWYYDTYMPYLKGMDQDAVKESGYWGRKSDHMLRVAMVLSAMEGSDLVIRERHVARGLKYLKEVERGLGAVLGSVGVGRNTAFLDRILHFLMKKGREDGVELRALRQGMWRYGSGLDLDHSIHDLKRAGKVEVDGKWIKYVKSKGKLILLGGGKG